MCLTTISGLLTIVATFLPIVSFDKQNFSFFDQFSFISIVIVLLSLALIFLHFLKKQKLLIIPLLLNSFFIISGLIKISNIDGIKLIVDFKYGVSLILYIITLYIYFITFIILLINTFKKKPTEEAYDLDELIEIFEEPSKF
jgi:hypothetical protein